MKKTIKLITLLLLLNVINSFAQKKLGAFENDLKTNTTASTESFSVVNNKTNNIANFLVDKINLYGYLTDENFNVTQKIASKNNKRK